jgi:hypothetical protein
MHCHPRLNGRRFSRGKVNTQVGLLAIAPARHAEGRVLIFSLGDNVDSSGVI